MNGSPFVVGLPLRSDQPIFGRDDTLQFIGDELKYFRSVNLVGERRMGKTSVINHLLGNQDRYLSSSGNEPPLVLAQVDLQANMVNAERFYGVALRELLTHLPGNPELAEQLAHQNQHPQASYDEFEQALRQWQNGDAPICPVLVVDEFEHLLAEDAAQGFPFPRFFDGMRSLITDGVLAMVIASRVPLIDYFTEPQRPNSLTSNFPTYFQPWKLDLLSDEDADALLLQPSERPLTPKEAEKSRDWAKGHPCRLQAAGAAWYQTKKGEKSENWAKIRFRELISQNCFVQPLPNDQPVNKANFLSRLWSGLLGLLKTIFWNLPLAVGRIVQKLGGKFDDAAAWIIGVIITALVILLLFGIISGSDLWQVIKNSLGLQ